MLQMGYEIIFFFLNASSYPSCLELSSFQISGSYLCLITWNAIISGSMCASRTVLRNIITTVALWHDWIPLIIEAIPLWRSCQRSPTATVMPGQSPTTFFHVRPTIIRLLAWCCALGCPRCWHVHSQKSCAHRWERDKSKKNMQTKRSYRLEMEEWEVTIACSTGTFIHGVHTIMCDKVRFWNSTGVQRDNSTCIARLRNFLREKHGFSVERCETSGANNCLFDALSKTKMRWGWANFVEKVGTELGPECMCNRRGAPVIWRSWCHGAEPRVLGLLALFFEGLVWCASWQCALASLISCEEYQCMLGQRGCRCGTWLCMVEHIWISACNECTMPGTNGSS